MGGIHPLRIRGHAVGFWSWKRWANLGNIILFISCFMLFLYIVKKTVDLLPFYMTIITCLYHINAVLMLFIIGCRISFLYAVDILDGIPCGVDGTLLFWRTKENAWLKSPFHLYPSIFIVCLSMHPNFAISIYIHDPQCLAWKGSGRDLSAGSWSRRAVDTGWYLETCRWDSQDSNLPGLRRGSKV